MNKRECIAHVAEQQANSWKQSTTYQKRTEIYNQCKDVCKQNGYIGTAFVQIWDAATRMNAISKGVYRG